MTEWSLAGWPDWAIYHRKGRFFKAYAIYYLTKSNTILNNLRKVIFDLGKDKVPFKDLKNIDLLIVDGPQGGDNSDARYPALEVLLKKLSAKAIVILDDVNRTGERKLAEDFAKALPNHELRILDHEKLTAVISPK